MSTPRNNAFAAAREQALTEITPHLQSPLDNTHPKWRVVLTDSESLTGLAPVCNQPGSDALHEITDYPGGPKRDDDGVYDCCPWPQIETYSEAMAAYLVGLLNADTEQAVKAATPDAEAYDGELAMLRGLVRTLRVIVRADGSPEKQRAEVRQLLAEHAGDEAHARLLAMDTGAPTEEAPRG